MINANQKNFNWMQAGKEDRMVTTYREKMEAKYIGWGEKLEPNTGTKHKGRGEKLEPN